MDGEGQPVSVPFFDRPFEALLYAAFHREAAFPGAEIAPDP